MAKLRTAHPIASPVRPGAAKPLRTATPQPQQARSAQPVQQQLAAGTQYNYNADPVLQRITALAAQNDANAEATALAARNQALINYGDAQGLGDANTAAAAAGNPFSVLANLANAHTNNVHTLNENLNKANLFYSGYRGQQLNNEQQNYLGQQYTAGQNLQGQLGGINQNLLAAHQADQNSVAQGYTDAADRAIAYAQQYGGPSGTTPGLPRASAPAVPVSRNLSTLRANLLRRP